MWSLSANENFCFSLCLSLSSHSLPDCIPIHSIQSYFHCWILLVLVILVWVRFFLQRNSVIRLALIVFFEQLSSFALLNCIGGLFFALVFFCLCWLYRWVLHLFQHFCIVRISTFSAHISTHIYTRTSSTYVRTFCNLYAKNKYHHNSHIRLSSVVVQKYTRYAL